MKKLYLTKEFTFDAAHKLINYEGKCKNLHGHTYKLQVTIQGTIQKNGMILDFREIKEIIEKNVVSKLDHSFINDFLSQPTAENTILWIWDKLVKKLPLYELKLWETPNSSVSYKGENDQK